MTASTDTPELALQVQGLRVERGGAEVVLGVDLALPAGDVLAILGPNGAGKSSLVDGICGLAKKRGGTVHLDGDDITGKRAYSIAQAGLIQVSQDRDLFPTMTVKENLELGQVAARNRPAQAGTSVEEVLDTFPVLRDRHAQAAGSLSGGEQQMLAIGRALVGRPRVLILDEPTAGLAPVIVQDLVKSVLAMSERGMTMIVVEQNVQVALETSERVLVLQRGSSAFAGRVSELGEDPRSAIIDYYV